MKDVGTLGTDVFIAVIDHQSGVSLSGAKLWRVSDDKSVTSFATLDPRLPTLQPPTAVPIGSKLVLPIAGSPRDGKEC